MKILVAEPLAPAGVKLLQEQPGWDVVVSNPKEYAQHLADADALLVRSAVKVNADTLSKAPKLKVIGRAGVGVDNVDLEAATTAGILVMNTPGGNAVSVAEHTFALMLSLARSIPLASASTKSGKWEKKKFLGNELRGKVLGIVGLGSIGREVVRRGKAFEMRVMASDPYVSSQTATSLGIELVDLDKLYAESDYISLHVALTPETKGMLSTAAFDKMKRGVRVVNCARGELIDEKALKVAMDAGKVAGAALDVFEKEPPADDPILTVETLVATPHIAGSTEEAQETVGIRIVEQLIEYLRNGVAINAVNIPALTAEQYRTVGPFVDLADRLGSFAAHIASGNASRVRMIYHGRIADQKTVLVRNAGVAGVLSRSVAVRTNTINAMQLADDRGLTVAEVHEHRADHTDSVRLELETDHGSVSVEGAVILGQPRLIQVDGIYCEAPLEGHLLFLKNQDVPGVIGYVGSVLGKHGVNIGTFSLGRRTPHGEAVCVIATDQSVSDAAVEELLKNQAVRQARTVEFKHATATANA